MPVWLRVEDPSSIQVFGAGYTKRWFPEENCRAFSKRQADCVAHIAVSSAEIKREALRLILRVPRLMFSCVEVESLREYADLVSAACMPESNSGENRGPVVAVPFLHLHDSTSYLLFCISQNMPNNGRNDTMLVSRRAGVKHSAPDSP